MYAKQHGICFVPIDVSKPLTDQGPFDCIIHKLYDHEWNLNLENFFHSHPKATVIDRPAAIQRLHNRISMLQPITQINIPNLNIPKQFVVQDSQSLKSLNINDFARDINFPVIVKPLLANGTNTAHSMSLVFNLEGLTKRLELDPPIVVQQFVNHGGVLFKVYVAGDYVKCVKRSSLPDVSKETIDKMALESGTGVMSFSQISSAVIAGDDGWSNSSCNNSGEKPKMPEPEFVEEVAKGLKEVIGLHLFNFDMIRDGKSDGYYVVDINYFPGYEKLPCYESLMVDFFMKIKKMQDEKKMMKKENDDEEVDKTQS
ncbi:hypothetical protein QVD17_20674 [Tagetes erecta]|uniref:Inositol-tetrakisphosphate 1-kinase n=1 Tax=Tagetes erecta TaxID=13708 RepID=A0AAD8KM46_TARER|nr:hypothetical protein QVD17_20674 [Tagetes erecta]